MKRTIVVIALALHALGWFGGGIQGVMLSVSPKGVSPDAVLFGGLSVVMIGLFSWVAHGVWTGRQGRTYATVALFTTAGALAAVGGALMLVGSLSASDSYLGPLGGLALFFGVLHLGLAAVGFHAARELPRATSAA